MWGRFKQLDIEHIKELKETDRYKEISGMESKNNFQFSDWFEIIS